MLAAVIELVTRGADAQRFTLVVEEVAQTEGFRLLLRLLRTLTSSFISLALLVPASTGKRRVTSPIVPIGDVHISAGTLDFRHHRSAVKSAIGSDLGLLEHI